jgi:hypothetical protein
MKKRQSLTILAILGGVGIALLLFQHRQPREPSKPTVAENASLQQQLKGRETRPPAPDAQPEQASAVPSRARQFDYVAERMKDPTYDWKQPINFFGKVVDENDQPVAGATAYFVWNDLSPEGTSRATTTSDAAGLFSLLNKTGKAMSVTASKHGYYSPRAENLRSYEYANPYNGLFTPNPTQPVVFHLRKKGVAEPLLVVKKALVIPKDGTPVGLDLLSGKLVTLENANLAVRCWTDDKKRDSFNRFDWKCRIEVVGGGLTESTNEFDFVAPIEGYRPLDEIDMTKALGRGWNDSVSKNYFVWLKSGVFGFLRFQMIAHGDHFLQIEGYLNPAGSRNLEFDSAVQPKQAVYE